MPLSEPERELVFLNVEEDYSKNRIPTSLSRQDLRAAVAAIDDWIDANLASFVAALPQAVRDGTTTRQKVRMFQHAIAKRWEVG